MRIGRKSRLQDLVIRVVVPAIEAAVKQHHAQLVSVITAKSHVTRNDDAALETTFGRLYSDYKRGELANILPSGQGLSSDSDVVIALSDALDLADVSITLPPDVVG